MTSTFWKGVSSVPEDANQQQLVTLATTKAQRLLAFLWDCQWHSSGSCARYVGRRHGASLHILRQAGWKITTTTGHGWANLKDDEWFLRLDSQHIGRPRPSKVRLYIPFEDAKLLSEGTVTDVVMDAAKEWCG